MAASDDGVGVDFLADGTESDVERPPPPLSALRFLFGGRWEGL